MRFTNFYKCFIKKFSHIAKSLNKLENKKVSQISYSLVVILELSSVSEVQYKKIMIIGDE